MPEVIEVQERDRTIAFTLDDMVRYHGPRSPASVAMAFKVTQRAFALYADAPPDRRSISMRTAFRGPGARDGFEAVTRAVDRALVRADLGRLPEDFVFDIAKL